MANYGKSKTKKTGAKCKKCGKMKSTCKCKY